MTSQTPCQPVTNK